MERRTGFVLGAVIGATLCLLLSGCAEPGAGFVAEEADFYECPPGRTLKVCEVGTGPPPGCTNVGSGQTTLTIEDCDPVVEAAPATTAPDETETEVQP